MSTNNTHDAIDDLLARVHTGLRMAKSASAEEPGTEHPTGSADDQSAPASDGSTVLEAGEDLDNGVGATAPAAAEGPAVDPLTGAGTVTALADNVPVDNINDPGTAHPANAEAEIKAAGVKLAALIDEKIDAQGLHKFASEFNAALETDIAQAYAEHAKTAAAQTSQNGPSLSEIVSASGIEAAVENTRKKAAYDAMLFCKLAEDAEAEDAEASGETQTAEALPEGDAGGEAPAEEGNIDDITALMQSAGGEAAAGAGEGEGDEEAALAEIAQILEAISTEADDTAVPTSEDEIADAMNASDTMTAEGVEPEALAQAQEAATIDELASPDVPVEQKVASLQRLRQVKRACRVVKYVQSAAHVIRAANATSGKA